MMIMYGRYKFTEFTAQFIDYIRTAVLGYSHEKFGEEILLNSQSTSFYLCTTKRRNHIYIDTLRKMFLVEYNAYLFGKKQEKMAELLDAAINQGIVSGKIYSTRKNGCANNKTKPQKTTLKRIFKTNNKLNSSINPQQLCIPITIYTIKKCVIDASIVNKEGSTENERNKIADTIFDEENFPADLRYVSIEYESLAYAEKNRVDKYISDRIDQIFARIIDKEHAEYPEELLYSEYWLYGMYLMHRTVEIPIDLQRYINRLYWNDENKTDWDGIFYKLRANEIIKKLYKYESDDFVYFKDEESPISKNNFPIFVYKYAPIHFEKKETDTSYCKESLMASTPNRYNGMGKITLIHLYMSLYAYFVQNGENEQSAFEHTGQKLAAYGVDCLPFNNPMLELYSLPQNPDIDLTSEATREFHSAIIRYFQNTELDEKKDADIIQFSKNHIQSPYVFMKAISFDFEIIKELNNSLAVELRDELQSTVKKFKIKNKL